MELARTLLVAVHVALGAGTLFLAPAALLAQKGGRRHRAWGEAYVAVMLAVCATATAITVARGSYGMLTVTLLPLYLVVSARFAMKPPRRRALLWLAPVSMLVVLGGVCAYALAKAAAGDADAAANLPLGLWAAVYCVIDLARARRGALLFTLRRRVHGARMILSYVTTVTAFAITNLRFLPPAVTTFAPLAVGLGGIAYLRWREPAEEADEIRAAR
jgi:uncharacterized membrane protein